MVTVALNYEEIESHPERVSNIKPFIRRCNWKGINYPSKIDDWKQFEKNNYTIVFNILYIKEKENVQLIFQKLTGTAKTNNSINDSKGRKRRMALSCSKRILFMTKRNNFKT